MRLHVVRFEGECMMGTSMCRRSQQDGFVVGTADWCMTAVSVMGLRLVQRD